jgi:general secretion pathway protein D
MKTFKIWMGCWVCGALLSAVASSEPQGIDSLFVREMPLRKFAELLTRGCGSGCKVMVSQKAAETQVSFYLADTDVEETLRSICSAYELWYRKLSGSAMIQIMTQTEYQQGLNLYAEEEVVVIPILYPTPDEIGESLAALFPDRVVWDPPDDFAEDQMDQIEDALDRMDTIADRATIVTDSDSGTSSSSSSSRSSSSDSEGASLDETYTRQTSELAIQQQRALQQESGTSTRPGLVYISSFPSANRLILRSSDSASLERIKKVVSELDQPPPQVLLEVKVLELVLSDEESVGVDWLFEAGDLSGGRSTGITDDAGGLIMSATDYLVQQGTGIDESAACFSLVTEQISARLQMLQESQSIKNIATPNLMVADNEASRIFIGTESTVLEKVESSVTYYGDDNENFTTSYTVDSSRERIGTTLLITPKIHADRSVTIRILQEESELGDTQTIQYGEDSDASFLAQDVDERSVVSTVLAQDGQTIAIGGLIREEDESTDSGFPILKDLPLIGSLFKTSSTCTLRSELLILIRPHVVLAPGEGGVLSEAYLQEHSQHPAGCVDAPEETL